MGASSRVVRQVRFSLVRLSAETPVRGGRTGVASALSMGLTTIARSAVARWSGSRRSETRVRASGVGLAVPALGGAVEQHGSFVAGETGEDLVIGGIQRPEA